MSYTKQGMKPFILLIALCFLLAGCGNENKPPLISHPDCSALGDFTPADSVTERTFLVQYIPYGDTNGRVEDDWQELKRVADVEEVRPIISRGRALGRERIWIETWMPHLAAHQSLAEGCYPERGRSQVLVPEELANRQGLELGDKVTLLDEKEYTVSGIYESATALEPPVLYISDELDRPQEFDELLVTFNQRADPDDAAEAILDHFRQREYPVLITNIKSDHSFSNEYLFK